MEFVTLALHWIVLLFVLSLRDRVKELQADADFLRKQLLDIRLEQIKQRR